MSPRDSQLTTENSKLPARRGAVAVVQSDDRLLVIRRSRHVRAPGAYCFPGGGIESGETPSEAVRRELFEELNAEVVPIRCLWQSTTSWNVHLAWWLAELTNPTQLLANPAEVQSFQWLTPTAIRALPELLESNHFFLDAWERGDFDLL